MIQVQVSKNDQTQSDQEEETLIHYLLITATRNLEVEIVQQCSINLRKEFMSL